LEKNVKILKTSLIIEKVWVSKSFEFGDKKSVLGEF